MEWAEGVKFYVAAVVGATLWKLWAFTRQAFFDECGVFAAGRHRPFQSGWSVRAKRPLGARRCLNLARRRHHSGTWKVTYFLLHNILYGYSIYLSSIHSFIHLSVDMYPPLTLPITIAIIMIISSHLATDVLAQCHVMPYHMQ